MEIHPIPALILAVAFIILNGFFVLAEFAIVKVRKTRIQELRARGNSLAPLLEKRILPQLDAYLSVSQVGITIASLALGWIGEPAVNHTIRKLLVMAGTEEQAIPYGLSFGFAFFIVTMGHVVLGELIPKTIAIQKADAMALFCARPLRFFYFLFYPVLILFNSTANGLLRLFGIQTKPDSEMAHSPQELRILLAGSKEKGIIDPQVFSIIDNAFLFRTKTVKDVMVQRDRVAVLSLGDSWNDNQDIILRNRHTRYPLCEKDIDNPVGLIHIKDIMLRGLLEKEDADLMKVRRVLVEIEPDLPLNKALPFLRSKSAHMAVVRSQGGKIEGIVCLEDIVELIIGNLEDEFDREERISILDLLKPEVIHLKVEAGGKDKLLRKGVDSFLSVKPDLDVEAAMDSLLKREKLFSIGIGGGVAVPHAVMEDLDRPLFAVMRLKKGIGFGAIDLLPVRLVFLFLLPATNAGLRLRFFSEIARLLQAPGAYNRILAASNPDKMVAEIRKILA